MKVNNVVTPYWHLVNNLQCCGMLDSVNPDAGASSADFRKGRRKKSATDARAASSVDRLPPHSIEAELGVLGCVMLSPNDCLGLCIEKFKAGSGVFYDLKHQAIY